MEKFNKTDRINNIAIKLMDKNITKNDINDVLTAERDYIIETLLSGDEVSLDGIGTFKIKTVALREAREMFSEITQKVEQIPEIPEHSTIRFKVLKSLKDEIKEKTLNNPFK